MHADIGEVALGSPDPVLLDRLRATSPLTVFLGAYALTAVLGNLLYLTPAGSMLPAMSISGWDGAFPMRLGPAFWLLVALPFLIAAPVAIGVGRLLGSTASRVSAAIPEIPPLPYSALCLALYAYVIVALIHAGAVDALLTPKTAVDAVKARFDLLGRLPFSVTAALKSILIYLAIYSIIRANRARTIFWRAAAITNFVGMIACLTLLSMKWPAVLFALTAAVAVFISAKRRYIIGSCAVAALGVAIYLILGALLLHIGAPPSQYSTRPGTNAGSAAVTSIPFLTEAAINRMAIALPYYYAFHDLHPGCPQSARLLYPKRDPACEPTLLVYRDLFPDDGFTGIGTAPAAVQMYGYALGGWPGALLGLGLASGIIGLFIALWPAARHNSIYAAALVMGAYTAYNFSQLPVEGPLIYDHGLWWAFLVLGWAGLWWAWVALARTARRFGAAT